MWLKWFAEMLHRRYGQASRARKRPAHRGWQFESLETRSLLHGASHEVWAFDRMPDHARLDRGPQREAPPRPAEIWDGRAARGWIDVSRYAFTSGREGRLPPRGEGEEGGALRGGRLGGFRQPTPGGLFPERGGTNSATTRSPMLDPAWNASRVLTLPPLDLRGSGNDSSVVESRAGQELAPSLPMAPGGPPSAAGRATSTGLFDVLENLVDELAVSTSGARSRAGDTGGAAQERTNSEFGLASPPLSLRGSLAAVDATSRDWPGAWEVGAWELSGWTAARANPLETYPEADSISLATNTWSMSVPVAEDDTISRDRNLPGDGPHPTDPHVEGGLVELEFARQLADESEPANQDGRWEPQDGVAHIVTSPGRDSSEIDLAHGAWQEGETRWITLDPFAIAGGTGTVPVDEGGLIELLRTSRDECNLPVSTPGDPVATSFGSPVWIPMDHGVGLFQAVELADSGPHTSLGGADVNLADDPLPDVAAIFGGESGKEGRLTEEAEGGSQLATLSPWIAGLAMISYWLQRQLARRSDRPADLERSQSTAGTLRLG